MDHELVCKHYNRKCHVKCPKCLNTYPCRLCHDECEDHIMDRFNIIEIRCNNCQHKQVPTNRCEKCDEKFAKNFCQKCNLWNDIDSYHCEQCKICRKGKQTDYQHCEKCGMCMLVDHHCMENLAESTCPICLDKFFDSFIDIIFLRCNHPVHETCLTQYLRSDYRCPICHKSVSDLKEYWQYLDEFLLNEEKLPVPYRYLKNDICCLDCQNKNKVKFHYRYHKCPDCGSYNTQKL